MGNFWKCSKSGGLYVFKLVILLGLILSKPFKIKVFYIEIPIDLLIFYIYNII